MAVLFMIHFIGAFAVAILIQIYGVEGLLDTKKYKVLLALVLLLGSWTSLCFLIKKVWKEPLEGVTNEDS